MCDNSSLFTVSCDECGGEGPLAETVEQSCQRWDRRDTYALEQQVVSLKTALNETVALILESGRKK